MTDSAQYFSGFDDLVGTRVIEASGDRVVAEIDVEPKHHQPFGIVHGGVHATLVETAASIGASMWLGEGGAAMGISNHTDFLRPASAGTLRIEALPLQRGNTMQLWQVSITDEQDRPVAIGRVRLFNRSS
jgi:1,4-dihydroxy-2-naphthoyl-CoA hydrolase